MASLDCAGQAVTMSGEPGRPHSRSRSRRRRDSALGGAVAVPVRAGRPTVPAEEPQHDGQGSWRIDANHEVECVRREEMQHWGEVIQRVTAGWAKIATSEVAVQRMWNQQMAENDIKRRYRAMARMRSLRPNGSTHDELADDRWEASMAADAAIRERLRWQHIARTLFERMECVVAQAGVQMEPRH